VNDDIRTEYYRARATHEEETRACACRPISATFVTLALAIGRTESWVCDRTGHKSSAMVARYNRPSRVARGAEPRMVHSARYVARRGGRGTAKIRHLFRNVFRIRNRWRRRGTR
jgi:hypothetical protein